MDEKTLDAITRMSLLQVIELRAAGWQQLHESTVSYYSNKLNALLMLQGSGGGGSTTTGIWPTADMTSGRWQPSHQTVTTPLSPIVSDAAAVALDGGGQQQLLLQPGQVVKSTGKYGTYTVSSASTPSSSSSMTVQQQQQASQANVGGGATAIGATTANNNNRLNGLYKDEVVIRNSDSGKGIINLILYLFTCDIISFVTWG
jgi:hypothetical protein